jgi:ABC-type hemin transport system substrate-binding protein
MRNVDIVGAQVDLNLEQVIKLKPDLVLITDGSAAKLAGPLERMGLKVQSIPDQTIEDIFVAIHKVGSLCQRPKSATALAAALRRDLERLSRLDQDPRKRAVLAINPLPPAPGALFVAGPGGHLHTLLALAGCDNAADRVVKRPWAEIGVETLVIAAPDCIIEYRPAGVPLNIDSLYDGWRGLATVPAIGQRCVRRLPDNTALVPGPRINIALHQLIELLND